MMLFMKSKKSKNSRPEAFCEKVVFRNFTKFTEKHLCQSLFFNEVVGLRPATLLKKKPWYWCFPMNFVKFLRILFLQNTSGRLLLKIPWITVSFTLATGFFKTWSAPDTGLFCRLNLFFTFGLFNIADVAVIWKERMLRYWKAVSVFYICIVTFTRLNVKTLQSPGNLNWYTTWEN